MRVRRVVGLVAVGLALLLGLQGRGAGQGKSFDKLSDEDREALAARFKKDLWPLLTRDGKDGCVGCHNGKPVTTLRFSADPDKDFAMLVRDGFFLKDDPGSLLARVLDKDPKRRMPRSQKLGWKDEDIQVLRTFAEAVHAKNK